MVMQGNYDEDLASYLEKTAAAVRQYSDHFERTYGRPAVQYSRASFEAQPLLATFVGIFGVLSILPIAAFIGASLFVAILVLSVALSCAFVVVAGVIFFFASILVVVLGGLFFLAIFLTFLSVSTYLLYRLFIHLRSEGGAAGFGEWLLETRDNLLLMSTIPKVRRSAAYVNAGGEGHVGGSGSTEKDEREPYENERKPYENEAYDDKGK